MKTRRIGVLDNWKDLKPHPLSALTAYGAGIDSVKISEHMRQHGYDATEPIVLHVGMILDGRHKHVAAQEADVVPSFAIYVGADPVAYVQKKLLRQHLTDSQRAMAAGGNRENAVSQYLAGLHGLRFVNLCRRAGKARSFATGELERDLSWWLGKAVDANLILRTYAAINLLHGDIMPPPSGAKAAEKNAWAEMVDRLPPVGHFHKAWSQLVERMDDGFEERWVLLPGFEERCTALYQDVQAKGVKLEDSTDGGKVLEKGIMTLTREHMIEFMRYKADKKAAEAAAKSDVKEELEEKAKDFEDKAQQQKKVVKSLLEQSQQAKPEAKAKLEQEAKAAAQVLEDYRKNMRQLVHQAAAVAKEAKQAEQEALESEKKADKGTAKLEKRRSEADNGRDLPWQALGENAAEKSTAKDLAEALYGIVSKHAEPEDVLYAMMQMHRKDASNAFKAALQAFGVTWERKTRSAEKVPA